MNVYTKTAGAFLILLPVSFAQQRSTKQEIHFDDPRIIRASERSIIPVYLCDFQGAEITLPKGELLRISSVGDSTNWVVTAVAEDRRDISVRPNEPMTRETILNVTSDHDNRYVFRLVLNDGHCDSHVTLEADQAIQQKISTEDPWVSPEKYKEALKAADDARKQAEQADNRAQQAARSAAQSEDRFQADYPKDLSFDYVYDRKQAEKFGVQAIFHDNKFTYVRALSEEPPVLFEKKDGKASLIEVTYDRGLYRTARIINDAYLVRGGSGNGKHQERLDFKRDSKLTASIDSVPNKTE